MVCRRGEFEMWDFEILLWSRDTALKWGERYVLSWVIHYAWASLGEHYLFWGKDEETDRKKYFTDQKSWFPLHLWASTYQGQGEAEIRRVIVWRSRSRFPNYFSLVANHYADSVAPKVQLVHCMCQECGRFQLKFAMEHKWDRTESRALFYICHCGIGIFM